MRFKYYKKPLSVLLACSMLFGNIAGSLSVMAEDQAVETVMESSSVERIPEVAETEAVRMYDFVLPEVSGFHYDYDSSYKAGKNGSEETLTFKAGDKVKIRVSVPDNVEISELRVLGKSGKDVKHKWNKDNGSLSLTMPEESISLWFSYSEKVVETESLPVFEPITEEAVVEEYIPIFEEFTETEAFETEIAYIPETEELYVPETEIVKAPETEGQYVTETEIVKVHETEEAEHSPAQDYELIIEDDGFPSQGSIVQVDTVTIPYDCWTFDPEHEVTGLGYDDETLYDVSYLSDDVDFVNPGTYSTIYRVQQKKTERMWYILRPVRGASPDEVIELPEETTSETESLAAEEETTDDSSDEDPDPEEESEVTTETSAETEYLPESTVLPETESEAVAEETENLETEMESETQSETEAESESETEAAADEVIIGDYSTYYEVPEEEMYYLTLPQEDEVLRKRTVWKDDTAFDFENYIPETSTVDKASVRLIKNNIKLSKCGEYELIYEAVLDGEPGYSWKIVVPVEVVAEKYLADLRSEEYDRIMYLTNPGNKDKKGEIPRLIGETVEGPEFTAFKGEDFDPSAVDLDYDYNIWGMCLVDDGGFNTEVTGTYDLTYQMFAWEDCGQEFFVKCSITVEEKKEIAGETTIHVTSNDVTALVVTKKTSQEATVGHTVVTAENIKKIVVNSAYGYDIDPNFTVLKNGEALSEEEVITKITEKNNTFTLEIDNSDKDVHSF